MGVRAAGPGRSRGRALGLYADLSTRIAVGSSLSLVSIAILVVFARAMRAVLVELEGDELLANVAFGGTILGLAAGLGAETLNAAGALRAGDGELSEPLAQTLFETSYACGSFAAGIGFGLLMVALGAAALRTGALLPRWLAMGAVAIGVGSITPLLGFAIGEYTVAPAFVVLFALGVLLLRGSALPGGPGKAA